MKDFGNQPIVIGATGGSGTRVLAKLCMDSGYYMGINLNDSLDSLEFVDFYDRWIDTSFLQDHISLSQEQIRQRDNEFLECVHAHRVSMLDLNARWGWKSPRCIFLLDLFHRHYPEMKFIHLVRDGRDMAYSSNQNQLLKHGHLLLVEKQWDNLTSPCRSILLWTLCNTRVSRYGQKMMGDHYLRIRFEDLCFEPKTTVDLLLNFLNVPDIDKSSLIEQIKPPNSIGRWRVKSEKELHHVVEWGHTGLEYFGYI